MSQTIYYYSQKPGDHVILLNLSVYSHCVHKKVHVKEKGDTSFDHGNGRQNRSCDNGDSRGDIRVDDRRRGYIYKDTSHFYSKNMGETFGGDGRVGYRSQTSHSSFHNPGDYGRLLNIPGSYLHVDDIIHENKRKDSRVDGTRLGSRSQENSHSCFHNFGEIVDVYGRSLYRSHTIPFTSQWCNKHT